MLAVLLALAVLVGLAIGLLGGGGSILSLPVLVYVGGIDAKIAIPMGLVIVGATSIAAMVPHAMAGNVRWRTGFTFGVASMVGAYLGGVAARWFSGGTLLALFAVLMTVSALAMLSGQRPKAAETHRVSLAPKSLSPGAKGGSKLSPRAKAALVVVEGFVVGCLTGLVGAGGGFLIVPTLVVLGGLSMRSAIGTSVLIISMKSFAGAAGHLAHVDLPWSLTAGFTAIAIVASWFGAKLTNRVPHAQLRRGFGVFVLSMGGVMIAQETGLFALMRERVWLAGPVGIALLSFVWWIARAIRPAPSTAGD
jgi:uncharacterized membrane protein YfcA